MHALVQAIPDPEVLLALEPEELGARLIPILRDRRENDFTVTGLLDGLQEDRTVGRKGYAPQHREAVERAFLEAWSWLESQSLIVWPNEMNGRNGWRCLSRRARRLADEQAVADYTASTRLPKSMLHPRIADRVWISFIRGEFDTAVFQAFREVEIAVREAGGYGKDDYGVDLVRKAFGPKGPLRRDSDQKNEADATAHLFAGAIGAFKNPQSHRLVAIDTAAEGAELVMLASLLLRMVDERKPTAE